MYNLLKHLYTCNPLYNLVIKMAIKDSGKVTVTFNRTTVEKLRSEKGGKAWDAFMLDLAESRKQGVRIKCVVCRRILESGDIDLTSRAFAKRFGWEEVSIKSKSGWVGFVCNICKGRK